MKKDLPQDKILKVDVPHTFEIRELAVQEERILQFIDPKKLLNADDFLCPIGRIPVNKTFVQLYAKVSKGVIHSIVSKVTNPFDKEGNCGCGSEERQKVLSKKIRRLLAETDKQHGPLTKLKSLSLVNNDGEIVIPKLKARILEKQIDIDISWEVGCIVIVVHNWLCYYCFHEIGSGCESLEPEDYIDYWPDVSF